jgi:CheY-like chemotaxis protein
MNGKIELKSKVGVGSTFSLKFSDIEYSEQKIDLTDNYSWTKQNIELNPSTILIVDDVTFNRDLIKSFFDNSNIRFVEAENGENGISEAKFHQPDLILMDIRMPGIDGYTTTRILKKRAETASIPVIALTASTMKSDIKKINQLFNGYLQKPVQKNFLVAELMKHLPYKELKSEDFHKDINPEEKSVEIPISLKEEFKSKFFIQIDEFRETIIVDELEDFIVTINDFAEEKGVLFLKNKIKTLKSDIAEFDLMKINNCLTEIKHFFS